MKTLIAAAAVAAINVSATMAAPSADSSDIFAEGGFFVGCNYWAKNAGMYMWSQWEPETVERELAALAAKYDLKAALNKKPGDFTALIRETKDLLNR